MANDKPTILFVHGSWHQPSHFSKIRQTFETAGYATSCPLQPSVGAEPTIGLMEDAQCIRDELNGLINTESKSVIVVAHSYGGVVSTQATDQSFAISERTSQGKKGGVLHILYMCAFVLPNNVSLSGAFGGNLPPWIVFEDDMCYPVNAEEVFYHDLSEDERKRWAGEIRRSPAITQHTAITQVAYMYHPVTYLFCENDAALPLAVQQMMVNNTVEKTGIKIGSETCAASHSPFLSMPLEVLRVVEKIAAQ